MRSSLKRFYTSTAVLLIFTLIFQGSGLVPISKAQTAIQTLEQHIPITTTTAFTSATTASPSDNSLGIIKFDPSQYSNATVYFEAVGYCESCSGGNTEADIHLYDTSGNLEATVGIGNTSSTRSRSGSLSLTNDEYTVRFNVDATSGTAHLDSARLIIIQSSANITNTQSNIELSTTQGSISSPTFISLNSPKYYYFDSSAFSPSPDTYFEATMHASDSTTTCEAQLYDTTASSAVSNSTISLTGSSPTRLRGEQIDAQIAENGHDGSRFSTSGFSDSQTTIGNNGGTSYDSYFRFTGITASGTIQESYLELYGISTSGSPFMKVFGVDEDNPTQPISATEFDNDTLTTANIEWDQGISNATWERSPSLNTIFQELVDSYTISSEAVMLQVQDDFSSSGGYNQVTDYNDSTTNAAKLHIEYAQKLSLSHQHQYEVRVRRSAGTGTCTIKNAQIIHQQSDGSGIAKTESIIPLSTTTKSHNNSTYTSQLTPIEFNPSNFSAGYISYFLEGTLSSSTNTGYARLYNTSDTTPVSNSEISTSSTSYERKRSSDLRNVMPATTKNLDLQLKNQTSYTTNATSAWLVTQFINEVVDPSLTFSVEGVAALTPTNGITTSTATEFGTLPFGNIGINQPKYIAHRLTVSTNTTYGYNVTAQLIYTMQGIYPGNNIDEFSNNGATWSNPQTWASPPGSNPNINTGWIGANTSDTRVSGWESASGLFGPLGTTSVTVMRSNSADAGTSAYITYALEVNNRQPTDQYAGTLMYNILPTY